MYFDLDDDQRALAGAARSFLTGFDTVGAARAALDAAPGTPVGTLDRQAWADSGFSAITVAEEHGGGGGSLLDLAVVAEQAGRVLAAPSLVTPARAAVLLTEHPEHLKALAAGTLAVAVNDGGPVLDAVGADRFLTLDRGRLSLCRGTVHPREAIDATRGLAPVTLTEPEDLGSATPVWERARQVGQVVLAAEGLGAAQAALDRGVEWAKQRHAFGRPIGSYQAIKHALVDVYVEVEQLRSLVWWAAWTADEAPQDLPLAAAAAKALAASTLELAAETLVQVHGGIGFTWEHDAHLFWRRAKVDRLLLGDEAEALDTVATVALT